MNRRYAHPLLAITVLALLGWAAFALVALRKQPEKQPPPPVIPRVNVVTMKATEIPVTIKANGTVRARTTTQLTSQVSGLIVSVSPQFQEGGFFRKGEVLVTIDPVRYETQVATAKAQLATAQLGLEQQEALAKRMRRDWKRLSKGEPSGLAANVPQLTKARADVEAAQATLKSAEHDLTNTQIVAPYTGRVRSKMADIGQSISALGAILADIYAIDYAEVVLPLSAADASFLDLPALGNQVSDTAKVTVHLTDTECHSWNGHIERTTGIVDSQSRFVKVIVRVDDPYGLNNPGPPLQIGQFVSANLAGRVLEGAFSVPREAVLPGDRVLVTKDNLIESRQVTIARKESDRVIVTNGLQPAERVIITRLPYYAEGMEVEPITSASEVPSGQLIDQVNAQ
ncbi:efflux RND transporter periplasmic adaptor subunit [bacterium]|nr:efflux RND transporter periplasmic adaptor subunit [bacterium]